MATRKVRYAVVGAGNIAQVAVLPAFANAGSNSELVAVVSGDEEKRRVLGERYGLEHLGGYDEYEEVLQASGADAVYIALPNHMHREYTERAAQAGVHVLCEKPMALTVEDCEAMIDACEEAGVKLMIAYRLHFEEANLTSIDLARKGNIGEPMIFAGLLTHQVRAGDIRQIADVGGGALYDEGLYCINAARYLFDAEPTEVSCNWNVGSDPRSEGVDDTTSAILRFPGGKLAIFAVSQVAASVSSFRLVGTEGDVLVEEAFAYVGDRTLRITRDGETEVRTISSQDQFAPELLYFSHCVLEDKEPEPSGLEGLADVRIMQALQESARTGRVVSLSPFSRGERPDPSQLIVRPAVEQQETVHAPSPTEG